MNPRTRRFAKVALALGLAWAVCAIALGPWLIRAGYSERLIPALNGVFSGRDVHAVDFYLGAWWSLVRVATLALFVLLAGAAGWVLSPEARCDLLDRMLGAADGLTPLDAVKLAPVAGLAAGLAEATYLTIRNEVTHRPAAIYHAEVLWMAPLSALVPALAIGCILALAARGGRRRIGTRVAVIVFGFLVVHSVMQSEGIALHPGAEIVLSLGLATVLARLVMRREETALRIARRSGTVLAVGLTVLASTAWFFRPASVEARALRSLSSAAEGLPNVIIVILDTARGANFSLHGYERDTSPGLVEWSRDGVVFDRAFATSSWTLPSHASLFTGQPNHQLGVGVHQPLEASHTTLAEALTDLGYHTGGFAANPFYTTTASGLAQGFARYEDRPWELRQVLHASWLSRLLVAPLANRIRPGPVLRHSRGDRITDGFLDWVRGRDPERPYFAFLNYFDAHDPYQLTPPDQVDRFGPPATEAWPVFEERFHTRGDTTGLGLWVNRYDAAIAYLDGEISRIRNWLDESGTLDNTVVVVTSDHGDMWGEQGELGHSESLFAPVIHIPMLISYPAGAPGGVRLDEAVSLVDLPRTIFDLIGVEAPDAFGGSSLAPLWAAGVDSTPRYALAELWPAEGDVRRTEHLLLGPMKSLIDRRLHYIRYGDGSEMLFGLDTDDRQLRDLVDDPAYADDLARLRAALDSLGGRW